VHTRSKQARLRLDRWRCRRQAEHSSQLANRNLNLGESLLRRLACRHGEHERDAGIDGHIEQTSQRSINNLWRCITVNRSSQRVRSLLDLGLRCTAGTTRRHGRRDSRDGCQNCSTSNRSFSLSDRNTGTLTFRISPNAGTASHYWTSETNSQCKGCKRQ